MFPITVVKRFLNRNVPNIPLPPNIDDDLESISGSWIVPSKPTSTSRSHIQNQALFQLLARHRLRSLLFRSLRDQDHVIFLPVKLMHYHLQNSGWNPNLLLSTLEVLLPRYCIPSLHQQRQRELRQIPQFWGSFKLRPSAYLLPPGFTIPPEPRRQQKPKNQSNPTRPRTASKRSSMTSVSPANFSARFMTQSSLTNTSTELARA